MPTPETTGFDLTTGLALAGAVLGLIGTTLSISNFLLNLRDRRVSLRVMPKVSFFTGRGFVSTSIYRPDDLNSLLAQAGQLPVPAIEIANLSRFTVEIDEVGFCARTPRKGPRHAFLGPLTIPNMERPYRMEPRSNVTFYAPKADPAFWMDRRLVRYAYAITGCGKVKRKRPRDFIKTKEHIRSLLEQDPQGPGRS